MEEKRNSINNFNKYSNILRKTSDVINKFIENCIMINVDENSDERIIPFTSIFSWDDEDSDILIFKSYTDDWIMEIICEPTKYTISLKEIGEEIQTTIFNYSSILKNHNELTEFHKLFCNIVPNMTFDVMVTFTEMLNDLCTAYRLTYSAYNICLEEIKSNHGKSSHEHIYKELYKFKNDNYENNLTNGIEISDFNLFQPLQYDIVYLKTKNKLFGSKILRNLLNKFVFIYTEYTKSNPIGHKTTMILPNSKKPYIYSNKDNYGIE